MTLLWRPFLTVNEERGGRTEKRGAMDRGGDGMEVVGGWRGFWDAAGHSGKHKVEQRAGIT